MRPHNETALLTTAANSLEADVIGSALRAEGIPCLLRPRGSGAHMRIYSGHSHTGVDVFVPQDMLEEARGVLGLQPGDEAP